MNFAARRSALEALRHTLAGHLVGPGCGLAGVSPPAGDDALRQVDVALARLVEGSYGICLLCGDAISEVHLDQQPAAPFCPCCTA